MIINLFFLLKKPKYKTPSEKKISCFNSHPLHSPLSLQLGIRTLNPHLNFVFDAFLNFSPIYTLSLLSQSLLLSLSLLSHCQPPHVNSAKHTRTIRGREIDDFRRETRDSGLLLFLWVSLSLSLSNSTHRHLCFGGEK